MSVLGCAPASLHPTYDSPVSVRLYLAVTAKPFASGTVGSGIALLGKGLWQSAFKRWIST